MPTCPCCKHTWSEPKKVKMDARLKKDLARANYSLQCLAAALHWPAEHESFYAAVRDEQVRMQRALLDHALLWRIYRRNEKGATAYATQITQESAA